MTKDEIGAMVREAATQLPGGLLEKKTPMDDGEVRAIFDCFAKLPEEVIKDFESGEWMDIDLSPAKRSLRELCPTHPLLISQKKEPAIITSTIINRLFDDQTYLREGKHRLYYNIIQVDSSYVQCDSYVLRLVAGQVEPEFETLGELGVWEHQDGTGETYQMKIYYKGQVTGNLIGGIDGVCLSTFDDCVTALAEEGFIIAADASMESPRM